MLIAYSAVALGLTVIGGVRHDYIYYLEQWQLVLSGQDPWSTNNAYGPLHNAFALLVPLHPLAPKIVTAAGLLLASGLLVLTLERDRAFSDWRSIYFLAFGLNALPIVSVYWFGNNDGFVAALVIARRPRTPRQASGPCGRAARTSNSRQVLPGAADPVFRARRPEDRYASYHQRACHGHRRHGHRHPALGPGVRRSHRFRRQPRRDDAVDLPSHLGHRSQASAWATGRTSW